MNNRLPLALLPLLLLAGCRSLDLTPHQVTPQRPTVSSNTNTTPEGAFELESGVTYDPGDSVDTPTTLKYGLGPRTEGFLGWSPLRYIEQPGDDGFGIGDLLIGIRHRFVTGADGRPSFAVQSITKLPTADEGEGLGNGELDWRMAFITTFGYGDFVLTNFYELGVLGEVDGDDTDLEHVVAFAGSGPPLGDFGTFGEIAGIYSPERDTEAGLVTTGLTWSERKDQIIDIGLILGFGNDGPDLQLFAGFTRGLGTGSELSRGLRRRR